MKPPGGLSSPIRAVPRGLGAVLLATAVILAGLPVGQGHADQTEEGWEVGVEVEIHSTILRPVGAWPIWLFEEGLPVRSTGGHSALNSKSSWVLKLEIEYEGHPDVDPKKVIIQFEIEIYKGNPDLDPQGLPTEKNRAAARITTPWGVYPIHGGYVDIDQVAGLSLNDVRWVAPDQIIGNPGAATEFASIPLFKHVECTPISEPIKVTGELWVTQKFIQTVAQAALMIPPNPISMLKVALWKFAAKEGAKAIAGQVIPWYTSHMVGKGEVEITPREEAILELRGGRVSRSMGPYWWKGYDFEVPGMDLHLDSSSDWYPDLNEDCHKPAPAPATEVTEPSLWSRLKSLVWDNETLEPEKLTHLAASIRNTPRASAVLLARAHADLERAGLLAPSPGNPEGWTERELLREAANLASLGALNTAILVHLMMRHFEAPLTWDDLGFAFDQMALDPENAVSILTTFILTMALQEQIRDRAGRTHYLKPSPITPVETPTPSAPFPTVPLRPTVEEGEPAAFLGKGDPSGLQLPEGALLSPFSDDVDDFFYLEVPTEGLPPGPLYLDVDPSIPAEERPSILVEEKDTDPPMEYWDPNDDWSRRLLDKVPWSKELPGFLAALLGDRAEVEIALLDGTILAGGVRTQGDKIRVLCVEPAGAGTIDLSPANGAFSALGDRIVESPTPPCDVPPDILARTDQATVDRILQSDDVVEAIKRAIAREQIVIETEGFFRGIAVGFGKHLARIDDRLNTPRPFVLEEGQELKTEFAGTPAVVTKNAQGQVIAKPETEWDGLPKGVPGTEPPAPEVHYVLDPNAAGDEPGAVVGWTTEGAQELMANDFPDSEWELSGDAGVYGIGGGMTMIDTSYISLW